MIRSAHLQMRIYQLYELESEVSFVDEEVQSKHFDLSADSGCILNHQPLNFSRRNLYILAKELTVQERLGSLLPFVRRKFAHSLMK